MSQSFSTISYVTYDNTNSQYKIILLKVSDNGLVAKKGASKIFLAAYNSHKW